MHNLKKRVIRGGVARLCSQSAVFIIRLGSLAILARLLDPKDFGMIAMVTAVTGILGTFMDFGLSTATIQYENVTNEQLSTLFWINLLIGVVLAVASVALSPALVAFYQEPRLLAVTSALAVGFILGAAGIQHSALLLREMRFATTAIIDIVALAASVCVGIGMAISGYGYWSLVGMSLALSTTSTVFMWIATRWFPGVPSLRGEVRSMMRFGTTVTLNRIVIYVSYNLEKILLGRVWGAEAIGLYGRAYNLINIPTENMTAAVGGVAFSALARLQGNTQRLNRYFLKGYTLVLTLTIPVSIYCFLFSKDLIRVLLGPKWNEAAAIFQLLAPTILVFALINPLSWLLQSLGLIERSLRLALAIAPLMITAYLIGIPYGPNGVAFASSAALTLWVVPHLAWAVHGTGISLRDMLLCLGRPLSSGVVAGAVAFGLCAFVGQFVGQGLPPIWRALLGGAALAGAYTGILLGVLGQRRFYLDLLGELRGRAGGDVAEPVAGRGL